MKNMKRLHKANTMELIMEGYKKTANGELLIRDGEKVPNLVWKKTKADYVPLKSFIRCMSNDFMSKNKIGYLSPKADRIRRGR